MVTSIKDSHKYMIQFMYIANLTKTYSMFNILKLVKNYIDKFFTRFDKNGEI